MTYTRRELLKIAGAGSVAGASSLALSGAASAASPPSQRALDDIPPSYLEAYRAAGREYGIDWTYLAGIGKVESQHGQYNPTGGDCILGARTPTGRAKGPMQFKDSTWEAYGVDGNGDGAADPCDHWDAIPAAANYLTASGAPGSYRDALYAYNHSEAYVRKVTSWADTYRGSGSGSDAGADTAAEPEGDTGGFGEGDRIESTTDQRTHYRPRVDSRVVETVAAASDGEIVNGPVDRNGETWWGIHWLSDDVWGWSVERRLADVRDRADRRG